MRILIILALVKILELSRYNLTNHQISRSFYNLLSLFLILAFFLYLFLTKYTAQYEKNIESAFMHVTKRCSLFLDILVLALVGFSVYRIGGFLYTHPIRCMTGDMLPMIRGAGEYFLSGENPFNKSFCGYIPYVYLPMMLMFYLPAILARIDIRFISLLCFATIIFLSYYYHRNRGFPLTGFFITIIIISSGLFPFLMLSVHTFPYLLILSCFLFALSEENDGILFFSLAMGLTLRKFFWFYVPFILVYIIKQRKINLSNLRFFGIGALIGMVPLLLFPHEVFITYFEHLKHQSGAILGLEKSYQMVHSLGFAYYLYDYRVVTYIISLIVLGLLFVLALKFLKKSNLWLFLSLITLVMIFIQIFTRAQEYYFFPLLVIIIFSPISHLYVTPPRKQLIYSTLTIFVFVICTAIGYPFVSGKELIINPMRGHQVMSPFGYNTYKGYLEVSIGGNFLWPGSDKLALLIKRPDYRETGPGHIKISINDKLYFSGNFHSQKIKLMIDRVSLRKYFYIGANDLEIDLLRAENFSVRIQKVNSP
jgi:hypothetical protein